MAGVSLTSAVMLIFKRNDPVLGLDLSVSFDVAAKDLPDWTRGDGETEGSRSRPSVMPGTPHGLKQYTARPPRRPPVHTRAVTAGQEHTAALTSPDSEK